MNLGLKTTLTHGVSKKTGNDYRAIEVWITDNTKKLVFINDAEYELLMLRQNEKK